MARRLRGLKGRAPQILGRGIRVAAEEMATDARQSRPGRGVPREFGALSASIGVRGPNTEGTVELYAGGASAGYAVIQHERTDFHHDLGEARYLVRAAERWRLDGSAAAEAIGDAFRVAVRSLGGG